MADRQPPIPEAAETLAVAREAAAERPLRAAALRVRALEDRLRFAYLRRVPAPLLEWIDPPLRSLAGAVRCAAALPLYLRGELGEWSGTLDGEALRVTTWGSPATARLLLPLFFDDDPTPVWKGGRGLRQLLRGEMIDPGRIVIAETTPLLAPLMRRAGCWIVPALLRQGTDVATACEARSRSSQGLKNDRRWMRRQGLRVEVQDYTPDRSTLFYERYLRPHAGARFPGREEPTRFDAVDRQFAAGFAIAVLDPEGTDPAAMAVAYPRGRTLVLSKLGVRDGDPELVRTRALVAIYDATPQVAASRGLSFIDAGRALPWRGNGVTLHKWKWGYRPMRDPGQTLEVALRLPPAADAVRRRLRGQQLIARRPEGFRVLTTTGWRRPDEALPWPDRGGDDGDERSSS